jgi:hypothetical protein
MVRRPNRRRLLGVAVACAAAVIVVVLVLIGLGVIILPSPSPATLTITEVQWTILQGNDPDGRGWFGDSPINETNQNGLPLHVDSGNTFSVAVALVGSADHTIYSVIAASPFRTLSTSPALPFTTTGVDDFVLSATVAAPTVSSSSSYVIVLTVNALS